MSPDDNGVAIEEMINPLDTLFGNLTDLPSRMETVYVPADFSIMQEIGLISKHQMLSMAIFDNLQFINGKLEQTVLTVPMLHNYIAQVVNDIAAEKLNSFQGQRGDVLITIEEDPTKIFPNTVMKEAPEGEVNNGNQE